MNILPVSVTISTNDHLIHVHVGISSGLHPGKQSDVCIHASTNMEDEVIMWGMNVQSIIIMVGRCMDAICIAWCQGKQKGYFHQDHRYVLLSNITGHIY